MDDPVSAPTSQIEAALRMTTETLARELASPSGSAPSWTAFEWRVARAVSALHGVSPLLRSRLRWNGPRDWVNFLDDQSDHSVRRHARIALLLREIHDRSRCQGLVLVALKGAALHALGFYAAGQRPMGDIDLLVRPSDEPASTRLLQGCDYEVAYVSRRHKAFQPKRSPAMPRVLLGEHVNTAVKIELHTRVAEQLPNVEITQCLMSRTASAGVSGYPSLVALMTHLLLHAAGNMRARALRLIQLHDIALVAAQFGRGDWQELIATRPCVNSVRWWTLAPLMLTERYYPGSVPEAVLTSVRKECSWLMAFTSKRYQLTDVSWSNIRIAAFPGIEWCSTPKELLSYVRSRIWPTRESLSELKDGAAQIPGESTIPWYGVSHPVRIVRWLISRPPRVQTLLSIRAAFAQEL